MLNDPRIFLLVRRQFNRVFTFYALAKSLILGGIPVFRMRGARQRAAAAAAGVGAAAGAAVPAAGEEDEE